MAAEDPETGTPSGEDPETATPADETPGRFRRWARRGAGGGGAAFAAGYVVLYLWYWAMGDTASETTDWVSIGWFFYRGHFVDITVGGDAAPAAVRTTESVLSATTVPDVLAPVAVLTAAGYLVGRETDPDPESALGAAAAGASLLAGYLPLAVLGSFVFRKGVAGGHPASPDLLGSVLLAGAAFPLVLGGVGGLAYHYREGRGRAALASTSGEDAGGADPAVEEPAVDEERREELEEELLEDDPAGERT